MLAFRIFRRAVTLILDNLGAALRISAVPYAILVAVTLYFAGSADMAEFARLEPGAGPQSLDALPPGFVVAVMVSAVAQVVAFVWISVAWHRYVLLAEGGQSWVPVPDGRRMLGYFGRSLLILLIVGCLFVAVTLAIGVFVPAAALVISLILGLVVSYRLGLILPAGAIGKPITIAQAWAATKGQSGTVALLAILTFLVSLLLQVPTLLDAGGPATLTPGADGAVVAEAPGIVTMIYSLVITWILLLLGVSLLSTLYGHFVEGRPLD